jgi:hypothetical protein
MYNAEKMIELINAYVPVRIVNFIENNEKCPTQKKDDTFRSKYTPKHNAEREDDEKDEDENAKFEKDENAKFEKDENPKFEEDLDPNFKSEKDGDSLFNKIQIEQFPVHREIWQEEFIDGLATDANNQDVNEVTGKMMSYLSKINELSALGEKLVYLTELFDYIATTSSALMLIHTSNSFKNSIANKILEYVDTGKFSVCSTKTKRFIYALTGKQA